MTIPSIIHQTYKNEDLPEVYEMCQNKIKELHPDFEYCFYNDDAIDNIVKNEFPEYYERFNKLPKMILKINVFKYFLMYKYGGIYIDMDYLMFKKFDIRNYTLVLPCNNEDFLKNPINIGDCIFASVPNHCFWKLVINNIFNNINYDDDFHEEKIKSITGNKILFSMYEKYSQLKNDIHVTERYLFHPISNNNEEYIQEIKNNGSYGMHLCSNLWKIYAD